MGKPEGAVDEACGQDIAEQGLSRQGGWDGPTLALFVGCLVVWAGALALPTGWGALALVMLVLALTLHSSLSHEILHGHPVPFAWVRTAMGIFQPGLFIPYLRFKRLHLAHHRDANLTDPYDDPETNYLDPDVWAGLPRAVQVLLGFNNTLFGRMLVGPAVGMWFFVRGDIEMVRRGDTRVAVDWVVHLPGAVAVVVLVVLSPLPLWLYLCACYGALSILKIRTFLEHRAHTRAAGRSVIIEDRGLLAFLFLNNNYHSVHHKHPGVSWHRLPQLYARGRAQYLARNGGYVYRSYGQVFRQFFLRAKDPVVHPHWLRR